MTTFDIITFFMNVFWFECRLSSGDWKTRHQLTILQLKLRTLNDLSQRNIYWKGEKRRILYWIENLSSKQTFNVSYGQLIGEILSLNTIVFTCHIHMLIFNPMKIIWLIKKIYILQYRDKIVGQTHWHTYNCYIIFM